MLKPIVRPLYHRALAALPAEAALQLQFMKAHGHAGNFREPVTFSEKIQWRKLFDDDPRYVEWSDKVRVKPIVADIIGPEWVIPTLWSGPVLPPIEDRNWPIPFVLKANHMSGGNYFARRADQLDWPRIEALADKWMHSDWSRHLHEDYYNRISRRLLVEPLIRGDLLNDYKFFCFSGQAKLIRVHTDRFTDHKICFYDADWNKQPFKMRRYPLETRDVRPPLHLQEMIAAAERLAKCFDFVRIDLYDLPEHPLFGEATFLPDSGFQPFSDPQIERVLGAWWKLSPGRADSTPD